LIYENLFNLVLIDPALNGADSLFVVGGYSSAAMLARHRSGDFAAEKNAIPANIRIQVIHGMYPQDGITRTDHEMFKSLSSPESTTEVRYLLTRPACHAKVYVWSTNGTPTTAFLGSANYSQGAFFGRTQEVLAPCDPEQALLYAQSIWSECIEVSNVQGIKAPAKRFKSTEVPTDSEIVISLLARGNVIPGGSGINWNLGTNRSHRKDKNAAYISTSNHTNKPGFFPSRSEVFLAHFDDGAIFPMRTMSAKVKGASIYNYGAITSAEDNQILGAYLRKRIGNAIGKNLDQQFIQMDDLVKYGRTSIKVTKLDDSTYHFDFARILA
jgi:hypothetical protein